MEDAGKGLGPPALRALCAGASSFLGEAGVADRVFVGCSQGRRAGRVVRTAGRLLRRLDEEWKGGDTARPVPRIGEGHRDVSDQGPRGHAGLLPGSLRRRTGSLVEAGGSLAGIPPGPPGELEKRLLLVYTGTSRHSGTNNWEVFKRHLDGDRRVYRLFEKIVEAGQEMVAALRRGDSRGVGRAMAAEAEARKRLFPGIMTREIRSLEQAVRRLGAIGTKVCGAGGGGCVVVYVDPEDKARSREKIRKMGFQDLPFKIVKKGLSFRGIEYP